MYTKFLFFLLLLAFAAPRAHAQVCTGSGSLGITVQNCSSTHSPEIPAVSLFPNPAPGYFEVSCSEPLIEIFLFDLCGKMVFSQSAIYAPKTVIHAEFLPEGLYTLRWRTAKAQGHGRLCFRQ